MQNKYWANEQWNGLSPTLDANGKIPINQLPNINPVAHKTSHSIGGSDALIDANIGLTPAVATALGLTGNPQVKDALLALYLGPGRQGYDLTFLYSNGRPVQNMPVTGIISVLSQPVSTDSNGHVFGVSTSLTPTVAISFTGYVDVDNFSTVVQGVYPIATKTITVPAKSTKTMNITSSQNVKFTNAVSTFDAVIVGGGGGGGGSFEAAYYATTIYGGGGGGGGYSNKYTNITPSGVYSIVIGAGGSGGISGYHYTNVTPTDVAATSGSSGGTTTMSGVGSASGGSGGGCGSSSERGYGGAGNGAGGNGGLSGSSQSAATQGTAGSNGFSGGGGGGGDTSGSGGSPYGGSGYYYYNWVTTPATPGSLGGGGGGGGGAGTTASSSTASGAGAPGGSGLVSLTWRLK